MPSFRQLVFNCVEQLLDEPEAMLDETHDQQATAIATGEVCGDAKLGRRHLCFEPGQETTATTPGWPCSVLYLVILCEDFEHAIREVITSLRSGQEIERLEQSTKLLEDVVQQCARLKTNPELFPTPEVEDTFRREMFAMFSSISKIQSLVQELEALPGFLKSNQAARLEENPNRKHYPGSEGPHPWNRWLENLNESASPWVVIKQRLPQTGTMIERLMARTYHQMNRALAMRGELVDEEEAKRNPSGVPPLQYDDPTWGNFASTRRNRLGFITGVASPFDDNGQVTLEALSRTVSIAMRKNKRIIRKKRAHCPYFEITLGYDPSRWATCS